MKPTTRVSIGGIAFNLDEDAYHVLNDYLQSLRKHFEPNAGAAEIVADIEMRLSELLQMRVSNPDSVVSVSDAYEIMKIMGNPKDFGDDVLDTEHTDYPPRVEDRQENSEKDFKKKLYRDPENSIIGGVFSGIGHYLKVDPTVLRILFIIVLFSSNFFSFRIGGMAVLAYLILWIAMPKATTFDQKIAMSGSDPSIQNIEDRSATGQRKYKGSRAGELIGIIIKIIVVIFAVNILLALIGVIVAFIWLYADTEILDVNNYLILLGLDTLNFKAALVMIPVIPLLGLLALMVKILNKSAFTSSSMMLVVVATAFWFGALSYIGAKVSKYAGRHDEEIVAANTKDVRVNSDTLYIKLTDVYNQAEQQVNNPIMYYRGDKSEQREVSILPTFKLRQDSTQSDFKIEVKKESFGKKRKDKRNISDTYLDIEQKDNSIIVNPEWYSNNKPWKAELFEIIITAPRNKKVIIEQPLSSTYNINTININQYDYFYRNDNYND